MVINELTQEIGERFSDALPAEKLSLIKWRGAFVRAAFASGWVTGDQPTMMKEVTNLYDQLAVIWREANNIPNA